MKQEVTKVVSLCKDGCQMWGALICLNIQVQSLLLHQITEVIHGEVVFATRKKSANLIHIVFCQTSIQILNYFLLSFLIYVAFLLLAVSLVKRPLGTWGCQRLWSVMVPVEGRPVVKHTMYESTTLHGPIGWSQFPWWHVPLRNFSHACGCCVLLFWPV